MMMMMMLAACIYSTACCSTRHYCQYGMAAAFQKKKNDIPEHNKGATDSEYYYCSYQKRQAAKTGHIICHALAIVFAGSMAVIELVAIWTFLQSCVSAISCESTASPAGIYYIAHRTVAYYQSYMYHVHASGDTDSARVANVMDPATDAVAFKRLLKWQRQKAAYTPSTRG